MLRLVRAGRDKKFIKALVKNNVKRGRLNKIKVKSEFDIEATAKAPRSKLNNTHCRINILVNVDGLSMILSITLVFTKVDLSPPKAVPEKKI